MHMTDHTSFLDIVKTYTIRGAAIFTGEYTPFLVILFIPIGWTVSPVQMSPRSEWMEPFPTVHVSSVGEGNTEIR